MNVGTWEIWKKVDDKTSCCFRVINRSNNGGDFDDDADVDDHDEDDDVDNFVNNDDVNAFDEDDDVDDFDDFDDFFVQVTEADAGEYRC